MSRVSAIFNTLLIAYVQLQSNKHYNWINIGGSFFSHSLNDKSLQATEIHDLNHGKSNILKLYLE